MSETTKTVHVVIGATGEYSDHREWPVAAYLDEAAAEAHVLRATQRAAEIAAGCSDHPYCFRRDDGEHRRTHHENEHDPDMKTDYTGTHYYIWSVPLVEAAP